MGTVGLRAHVVGSMPHSHFKSYRNLPVLIFGFIFTFIFTYDFEQISIRFVCSCKDMIENLDTKLMAHLY